MKRLTISMSDELFDKLDVIENKSLFIRKLIERELDAVDNFPSEEVIPWSEGFSILKNDVNTISKRLEEMESKLAGMSPAYENEPLMQESFDPVLQETPEQIPALHEDLAQNIDSHETAAPVLQIPTENISTPNITENIDADHPDIQVPVEADTGITMEEVHETAINNLEIETVKTEDFGNIEKQIPELNVPINTQEAAETVPPVETTAQEPTSMETVIMEEQIIPDEMTVQVENKEVVFSHSLPETELQSAATTEIPQEHKLSELVAEKIHKETEEEISHFNEPEMPSFMPSEQETVQPDYQMPEFKPPEQEMTQQEFQMPEFKPPEQEMTQQEFQMPEFKPPEQEMTQQEFQMSEFKPPEQEMTQQEFQMPEFKPLEQEMTQPEPHMPKFKPPEQEMTQQEFQMPEFKPPEQEMTQTEFQMPEFKPPEQEMAQTEFQMPEFKPPEQEMTQQEFQMPEFKPPEQEMTQQEFQMPEFKPPEQEIPQTEFQMPEFKPPEQEMAQTAFAMPELQMPETAPLPPANDAEFAMPEMKAPDIPPATGQAMPPFNMGTETMPEMQSTAPQMQAPGVQDDTNQGTGTKPDKLETNILMYMPRGAKVKKEIIKSLVSRQFSQEDIEKKIQELVARQILILKQENGVEQLHRLK
jgi:hypothetical protein